MTSIEEFNCIFCNESFTTKEHLQEHFRKHGDPKFNESIKSKTRLLNEAQTCEKWTEDGETVSCDVCTEMFPTISKAITHKHKVHPDHDAKYFCPWCGKLFTMKHLYNKHIQTNHESGEGGEEKCFHCDYCEVDFLVASAMVYHNKFFHRQDTELAAIGQSRKLKMFGQEPLQIYFCPFCGEEYHNKVNLHKHMGDDHSDENQSPDDVLRCPLCAAVFYHLDAYEVHLTFHSTGDIYSEENETLSEVVEFSLETVPPVMEKVENCESQEEAEATMNSIGIENFLQQAMNEAENDNSNSEVVPGKKKKHKKHKKSKKSAITLDEFLNMNKDVFGEGIDFQGIEEVPTQVVAKQLKRKPSRPKTIPKSMQSMELQKLKKQGIVVKMKSGKNCSKLQGMKVGTDKPVTVRTSVPNQRTHIAPAKSNIISTSSDVLTKLLNQSNSQLKIVKTSAQESLKAEQPDSFDTINTTENKTSALTECTELNNYDSGTKKENTNKDMSPNGECDASKNIIDKQNRIGMESPEVGKDTTTSKDTSQATLTKLISPVSTESDEKNTKIVNDSNEMSYDKLKKTEENIEFQKSDTNSENTLHALRNISQDITIKSVSSSNSILRPPNKPLKIETEDFSNTAEKGHSVTKENIESIAVPIEKHENKCKDSLNALKHLSHLITVKPSNQSKPTSPIGARNIIAEDKVALEEIAHNDEMVKNVHIDQPVFEFPKNDVILDVKQSKDQNETSKSIDALKNLSKDITIKSVNQSSNTSKSIDKSFNDESFHGEREYEDDLDDDVLIKLKTNSVCDDKNIETPSHSRTTLKKAALLKKCEIKTQPTNNLPKVIPIPWKEMDKPDEQLNFSNENVIKQEFCANNKQQQSNVTAKPLHIVKSMQQVSTSSTMTSSSQTMNVKNSNVIQKCVKKEETKEEIEIFNIDDSDDEILNSQDTSMKKFINNTSVNDLSLEHTNPVMKPIDALKNLSKHITVKSKMQQPINKEFISPKQKLQDRKDDLPANESDNDNVKTSALKNLCKNITVKSRNQQQSHLNKELASRAKMIDDKNHNLDELDNDSNVKSANALKNLSKHITVKSTNQQKMLKNKFYQEQMIDDGDNDFYSEESDNDSNVKSANALKNLSKHITVKSTNQQKLVKNKFSQEQMMDDGDHDFHSEESDNDSNVKSANALKNLSKHITVKSKNQQKLLSNKFSQEQIIDDGDHHFHSEESDNENNVKSANASKNLSKHITVKSKTQQMLLSNKFSREQMLDDGGHDFNSDESDNDSNVRSENALKNLSKHITVKSTNQQKLLKNKISPECMVDGHDTLYDRHMNNAKDLEKLSNQKPFAQKNTSLQQTLKYLGKNVSVQSSNSSPAISEAKHPKKNVLLEGYDSDSNSSSKRVQITEIADENLRDDDFTLEQHKNECKLNKNIVVDEPNSDDEQDFPDIESEIQTHIFHKTNLSNPDTIKASSKNITTNTKVDNKEDDNETDTGWDANMKIPNISNELSIKPFKQMKPTHKEENNAYSTNKTAMAHVSTRTMNQSAMNQRVATSSGQVNSVNKEVTVKTFQTKTVVQEITTTVTKTIRTINQNVKQEVRNMCQSSMPIMRPQKVQGMRPNQPMRNYQGGPVRQATPSVGPRIRNPGPRVAVGTTVKPSNQLVPVRHTMNIPRTNSPRMPTMKKATSSTCNPQQPAMGKALKISPNALMPATKRPNSDESSGPFSCFKKPKESLIPVPDVPSFSNSQGTVQFASSSHTSRSNFSSSTKMVKGNSMVSSTHMKSEDSTSSEQLSRLSNTSGLKVAQASRKQTHQVEENSQISASKRTALAAIEKLQKQGLLVKKPRLDEDNVSEKSHSDGEDYCDT